MDIKKTDYLFHLLFLFLGLQSCQPPPPDNVPEPLSINTAHLDHLFEKILIPGGDTVGIIHIYSEYPDYQRVGVSDEGIACIDDVARAIIFYLRNYQYTQAAESLEKAKLLLKFLVFMQAENGYVYNFIFPDHSINRDGITSKAEANWWSWRALWALGEALSIIDSKTPGFDHLIECRNRLVDVIIRDFGAAGVDSFVQIEGLSIPQWLPGQSASDQAALMVLGLVLARDYRVEETRPILESLLKGIQQMQIINNYEFPHGAFLSWQNTWHAYGNAQSYALLQAFKMTKDSSLLLSVLAEMDFFIKEWNARNKMSQFKARKTDQEITMYEVSPYPQIAYNLRPVIWACLEAAAITKEMHYADMAHNISQWFTGENAAQTAMYDPLNGRCFDGINDEKTVNRNSGAESTIEALLAIQELVYFERSKE